VIHLDTSVLVDALAGTRGAPPAPPRPGEHRARRPHSRRVVEQGERVAISTLVLYEWLRGPRAETELADQEELFPAEHAAPFGPREAARAAELYRAVHRARGRELDLGVAACALAHGASLWTLNPKDFRDVPGLTLYGGGGRR
jgi:predicted nucleic acid-binding protein